MRLGCPTHHRHYHHHRHGQHHQPVNLPQQGRGCKQPAHPQVNGIGIGFGRWGRLGRGYGFARAVVERLRAGNGGGAIVADGVFFVLDQVDQVAPRARRSPNLMGCQSFGESSSLLMRVPLVLPRS